MSAQHTAGPWTSRHEAESGHYEVRDESNQIVAQVFYVTNAPCPQGEADARLIAAAPDLLELAYQYQSDLLHPPTADSITRRLERIAAVLAKVGVA